jgi:hypothetical protein
MLTNLHPTIAALAPHVEPDIAIGGKLRVSCSLEFLWAIKDRMQDIRGALAMGDLAEAKRLTHQVEWGIKELVAEASK